MSSSRPRNGPRPVLTPRTPSNQVEVPSPINFFIEYSYILDGGPYKADRFRTLRFLAYSEPTDLFATVIRQWEDLVRVKLPAALQGKVWCFSYTDAQEDGPPRTIFLHKADRIGKMKLRPTPHNWSGTCIHIRANIKPDSGFRRRAKGSCEIPFAKPLINEDIVEDELPSDSESVAPLPNTNGLPMPPLQPLQPNELASLLPEQEGW